MFDVVIAGGGIAGSTLAILLGRQGRSVGLYERATFPREKACGEGLMPGGVAVLQRLGLAEVAGGAPFEGVLYHFGEAVARGRFPRSNGLPAYGYGQRRLHLDRVLFEAAASTPGVEAFSGARVDGPLLESGRVAGLCVEGQPQRAKLTVAADGRHSEIARRSGLDGYAPSHRQRFGVRVHYRLARGQSWPSWVEVFVRRGRELYVTPLPGGEVMISALARNRMPNGSAESLFRGWCAAEPSLVARLEGAAQISELQGASPLTYRRRQRIAPGLALLGDAAGCTDPITGGGMSQALMGAELLAGYVGRHLLVADDSWLQRFDREREAMLRKYRLVTASLLLLTDRPVLARGVIRTLHHVPWAFSELLGVCAGMPSQLAIKRTVPNARPAENVAGWQTTDGSR